jgi:hypothetical protein
MLLCEPVDDDSDETGMPAKKSSSAKPRSNDAFASVVAAFGKQRTVTSGEGKGFGTGALKVGGKIFAMISSKGDFVVKLPKPRVAWLIKNGIGKPFGTGSGRVMKEWVVIKPGQGDWTMLAQEACRFVGAAKT